MGQSKASFLTTYQNIEKSSVDFIFTGMLDLKSKSQFLTVKFSFLIYKKRPEQRANGAKQGEFISNVSKFRKIVCGLFKNKFI